MRSASHETNTAPQLWDTSLRTIIAAAEFASLARGSAHCETEATGNANRVAVHVCGCEAQPLDTVEVEPAHRSKMNGTQSIRRRVEGIAMRVSTPATDNCVTPLSVRPMKEKKPRFPRQRRLGPTRRVGSSPSKPVVLGQGWRHRSGAHPRQGPAFAGVRKTRTARQP